MASVFLFVHQFILSWLLLTEAGEDSFTRSQSPESKVTTEMASSPSEDRQWVQPLEDSTLLLITTNAKLSNQVDWFLVTKLNNNLKRVWQQRFGQAPFSRLIQVSTESNIAYLLFAVSNSPFLLLYQVDLPTGKAWYTQHELPAEDIALNSMSVNRMVVSQGVLLLSSLQGGTTLVLQLDPKYVKIQLLPAIYGLDEQLVDLKMDPVTLAAEMAVTGFNRIQPRLQVKRLTSAGQILSSHFIQSRRDNSLQQAAIAPGKPDEKLLFGTFGHRNSPFCQGFFSSNLTGDIKFYSLGQLQRFFDYEASPQLERQKKKFGRRAQLKKPMPAKYQLLLHPILPHPEGFVVVGEVYQTQKSRTPYTNIMSFNRGTVTDGFYKQAAPRIPLNKINSGGSFDNIQGLYTSHHFKAGVVLFFDKQGNLLWDNSQVINKKQSSLEPTLKAAVASDGRIILASLKDGTVQHQSFTATGNSSIPIPEKASINPSSQKVTSGNPEGVIRWYSNTFVSYRYQRAKTKDGKDKSVFHLQKLSL